MGRCRLFCVEMYEEDDDVLENRESTFEVLGGAVTMIEMNLQSDINLGILLSILIIIIM